MPRGIPKKAKDTPVALNTQRVDSTDIPLPSLPPRLLKSTGPAESALDPGSEIVTTQKMPDPEKAAMLAFMNEQIEIRIATTSDKTQAQQFEININGRNYFFVRGVKRTVPRYVADWLARRVTESLSQREVVNAEGVKDILHDRVPARVYDFSVERDDNPLGRQWLAAALAGR